MKKPNWALNKGRAKRVEKTETYWVFGIHAVRDALKNPERQKTRLIVTKNALDRLGPIVDASALRVEISDARRFSAPLDSGSVHQGAALEVYALDWGRLEAVAEKGCLLVLLDRVSDPHNVGAILRSAEVFGAGGVIAPHRHAAPEGGAFAKAASGALERLPYFRIRNLGDTMRMLVEKDYCLIGLDGEGTLTLAAAKAQSHGRPIAIVLGAEGPGLRVRTKSLCDVLAAIPSAGGFGSLNVSNAAAIALHALSAPDGVIDDVI